LVQRRFQKESSNAALLFSGRKRVSGLNEEFV
jgi:hypothetical protein